MVGPEPRGDLGQPGERPLRLPAQRRDRHQPAQPQRAGAGHRLGHRAEAAVRVGRVRQRAAPGRVAVELTCTSTSSGRSRSGRAAAASSAVASRTLSTECTTSAYRTTDRHLLRCSWPTKCQRGVDPGRRDLGGLGRRLLVAVLPDVGDAEPASAHHVAGRVGLGDRDQGDLGRGPGRRRRRRRRSAPRTAARPAASSARRSGRHRGWSSASSARAQEPFLRKSGTSTSSKSTRRGGCVRRPAGGRRRDRRAAAAPAGCWSALRGGSAGL